MDTVKNDKKSAAEKAVEAKAPTDGPHSYRARKALKSQQPTSDAAYVVVVSKKEKPIEEKPKSFYTQEEIRAKARSLLSSNKISNEERQVLRDILGPEKEG